MQTPYRIRIATALIAGLVACGVTALQPATLLPSDSPAPPEIRDACALAEQKCTRCHTLGRVVSFRTADWAPVVARMRRNTASTITDADEQVILRCLRYRQEQQQQEQQATDP